MILLHASKVTTAQPLSFRRRQFPSQLGHLNNLNLSLSKCVATFALLAVPAITPDTALADGGSVDTLFFTDEPGSWFKSQRTGSPFTAINTIAATDADKRAKWDTGAPLVINQND
jgi:hypothetical protein